MKKYRFTFFIALIFGLKMFGQTESYTAMKVTGNNVPVIDGTIDVIWQEVNIISLAKVPEVGGVVHTNITVPAPEASDYKAEFGMLWNDTGMFFIFRVVDEKIVIEDDNSTLSAVPADQWWTDDNINILFSKDLVNTTFTQWEFAWQPGIDQEEKLSSNDWLNPAVIDISMVQSAWFKEGTTWTLETFINWKSFNDGNTTIVAGQSIYLEARARDDDDGGTWETMFQWSTKNYGVESDGVGMGTVTLSATEVQAASISEIQNSNLNITISPNPVKDVVKVYFKLNKNEMVNISLYDMNGKLLNTKFEEFRNAGKQEAEFNISSLNSGVYFLELKSETHIEKIRFIKL